MTQNSKVFFQTTVILIFFTGLPVCAQVSWSNFQFRKADVSIAYRIAEGNISQRMFTFRSAFLLQNKHWALEPNFNYSLTQIFSNRLESDVFTWMTVKYLPENKFYPLVGGFYENSLLRSIELRYSFGAGIGYNLWQKAGLQLELFHMATYLSTRFEINKLLDYQGMANSLGYEATIVIVKDRLIFKQQLYSLLLYQDIKNFSIRAFNSLLIPITAKLIISFNLEYLNEIIIDENRNQQNILSTGGIQYSINGKEKK